MRIKNEEVIKELIKADFDIPLSDLEMIDLIISRTETQSISDWEKVLKYLKKYTEWTKELYDFWTFKNTLNSYYRYLKITNHTDADIFPKEDFHYIAERMEISIEESKSQIAIECAREAFKIIGRDCLKIGESYH